MRVGGGTGDGEVELVVEDGERLVSPTKEGERVVEVGVFGLGLCSGEATWLVR